MEGEVFIRWFPQLPSLSLLKQYLLIKVGCFLKIIIIVLKIIIIVTILIIVIMRGGEGYLKGVILIIVIMIGRGGYLKGVSGGTSHIDHSDALRALTRTLIKMIVMMIINWHHNRSSKSSTLS